MTHPNGPALSVIIPVHNGTPALEQCLNAVAAQVRDSDEIIVVDDGLIEDIGPLARRISAKMVRLDRQSGVAAARNRGAQAARATVLFFVDSDVVLCRDGLERVRAHLTNPAIDAVIGSYDDRPTAPTLVSQFKNLAHHYFHQRAAGPIGSFWGACGAVRREIFEAVGGFDERRYSRPSIEDVELGWRMADRGARIVLDPDLHITHLKRWTLRSLIATDIWYRAVPWIHGSIERKRLSGELNTSFVQRLASVLTIVMVVSAALAVPFARWRLVLVASSVAAALVNWPLFRLFWRQGGLPLLIAGFFLQQLYYLCALAGLILGVVSYIWPGRRPLSAPAPRGA